MAALQQITDKAQCFRFACGLLRQGRVDETEAAFLRCLELSKQKEDIDFVRDVYLELGQLRNQQGQYRDALKTYQEGLALIPEDASLFFAVAQLLRLNATSLKEIQSAEEYLRKTLVAQEKHPQEELSVRAVKQDLAMILCQLGRDDEAREILISLNYLYRLSRSVLCYRRDVESKESNGGHCTVVDQTLPPKLLEAMQHAFSPKSTFWREHNYPRSGYFSYLHSLTEPPSNSMDQLVQYLHKVAMAHFPQAKNARFAEWWAHTRPHGAGHQMHFDSDDEGRGGVHNPLVGSIFYLTEGDVGGPTLVTDQQQQHKRSAEKGWLVFPKLNRFAMFQGDLLHCVIPGRLGEGIPPPPQDGRRATFMVAFWDTVRPQMQLNGAPGASQMFPKANTTKAEWPSLFRSLPEDFTATSASVVPGVCTPVDSVWEDVDLAANKAKKIELASLTGIFDYESGFQGF